MGKTPKSPRRWRRRLIRAVVLFVLIPYLAVTLIFVALQRQFLYPGVRAAVPAERRVASEREVRDVRLTTSDGLELHGWLVAPVPVSTGDEASPEGGSSDATLVIFFPGNAENRWGRLTDCRDFTLAGAHVLLFDYRGYGENPGSPSEAALAGDAREIWQFAVRELQFRPERIVLFGESLGGAIATRLAAETSREGTPPAGLILNSTFASLPETVGWHYPLFPFRYLLLDRYPTAERIRGVTCPVVIFHGTEDEFVPLEHGRRLFAAAPESSRGGVPKRFVELRGSGHNSLPASTLHEALDGVLAPTRDRQ
jgi:uncharacterized protein